MKHTYSAEAHGFRLRPVGMEDAEFIISLRSDPQHARYLNPTSKNVEEQHAYLDRYFIKPGDYSFVLENTVLGRREGLAAIFDHNVEKKEAEWGRWILNHGSLGASACVWLVYSIAFEQIGVDAIYCRTVEANSTVISFHDNYGLKRARSLPGYFVRGSEVFDSIEHRLERSAWPQIKARHEPFLKRIHERQLARKAT
jgi:RimJ/RimL family protein N-acetyltransferase